MATDKNAPYAEFGARLYKLRTENGMSRQDLAEQCGIVAATIFNYEKGTRIPYADTALKMAHVFGLTVEEFLGMDNPYAEMMKARAVDEVGRLFGHKSAESAQVYLDGANALLAGGTLSVEEQMDFIDIMRKVLIDAEIRAKEQYTPHKFRTPTWEKKTAELRSKGNAAIEAIDEEMQSRSGDSDDED